MPKQPNLDLPGSRREGGHLIEETLTLLTIRRGSPDDAQALTDLMHASGAYSGGYANILEGYAVTRAQIEKDIFYLADQGGSVVGFYSLTLDSEPELDLMFVSDNMQGTGLGATLFQHMKDEAKRRGISAIKIVSHPPSVGFYKKMGATVVGTKAPTAKAAWARPVLTLPVGTQT